MPLRVSQNGGNCSIDSLQKEDEGRGRKKGKIGG